MMRRALVAAALLAFITTTPAGATTLPAGFTETLITNSVVAATSMAIAPDGRIFVLEQGGAIRIIQNGVLLGTPFATINVNAALERGLLGLAFDPNFASNQFVYIYYTAPSPAPHNRVSRLTANGNVAVAGSELQLLNLPNLSSAENHNGGALHFAPDGTLFIGVGDNANAALAPSLTSTMGKMLRINSNGTIPSNNPFFSQTTGINQSIWAIGFRNPFTFSFQPGTGRLFINDVGNLTWEEINNGVAGANYGWGPALNDGDPTAFHRYGNATVVIPGTDAACAITGGTFYNPPTANFPAAYVGKYFFSDYCGEWIRSIDPTNAASITNFATGLGTFGSVVDLDVAADGSLYYLARADSSVYRIRYTATPTPTARPTATSTSRPTATATTRPRATATATMTPPPDGCAIGATCEAETAARGGGVLVSALHAGYTGAGFADYQGNGTGFVEWTVNVPSAGTYTLNIRYANGGTGDRPMAIAVNGTTVVSSMSFPVTGWTSWTVRTQSVSLPAGVVRIRATELPNGPNVDNLVVTAGATPTATVRPRVTPTNTATPTSTTRPRATPTFTPTVRGLPTPTFTATPPRATPTTPRATPTTPRATPTSGTTPAWAPNTFYAVNAMVTYGGATYRCQQAHTSQVGWEPPNVPALWVRQ
jgi:glucose/arabinose dehydrogenase